MAFPTPGDGVRRAWGVTLLDARLDDHGNPSAFVVLVDAETGQVWQRTNKLEHVAAGAGPSTVVMPAALPAAQAAPGGGSFAGRTDQAGCGAPFEFEVPEGTGEITITVQSPTNPNTDTVVADLVANILYEGRVVATGDTLGNPEAATYSPRDAEVPGTFAAQACNYDAADPPVDYTGSYVLSPVGTGAVGGDEGLVNLPAWKVFPANPPFVAGMQPAAVDSPDTRVLWCWDIRRFEDCVEEQRNTASRLPWDVNAPSAPSFTTDGNNASTAVSEVVFLAPDTVVNRPVSPDRNYDYPWKNAWFEGSCNPTQFGAADPVTGGPNDEAAATANLFVQHNRMHDWSYYLGFTEVNSNLQKSNFGNTGPELENDPELGSSQAGRRTFNGRDNANQITLGDG
ncbi:MAG: M36 family metallopeptidase, partial [Actinomycetes bacterium]